MNTSSPPRRTIVQIDRVTFLVTSFDFQGGYDASTRHYATQEAGRLLVDAHLYACLLTSLSDASTSQHWKAGFLVGFLDALLKEGRP